MTIFFYTHIVRYIESAECMTHCAPIGDLANGAWLLSQRFCHGAAVERDQVFQGSQNVKKKKKQRLEKAKNTLLVAEVKAKAEEEKEGEEEQQEKVVNKPITTPPGVERQVHTKRL